MGESVVERTRRAVLGGSLRTDAVIALLCTVLDVLSTDRENAWRWGGTPPVWAVPVYCAVGALPLLVRRRAPGVVLALALVYAWGGLLMEGLMPFFVPLAAVQAYVARRPPRRGVLAVLGLVPPAAFNVVDSGEIREGDVNSVVIYVVAAVLLVVAAYTTGRAEAGYQQRAALAEDRLAAATEEALSAERRRLARELHDSLGHAITAMSLQAAGARAVVGAAAGRVDPRVGTALGAIEASGAEAMRELHRLLGVLRTQGGVAGADTGAPGVADLPRLVDGARGSGLVVHVDVQPDLGLDPSVDLAVYRVVQEALSNAMRHEGPGAVVDVRVDLDPALGTGVSVATRSPGVRRAPGSPADRGGFGLSGLRERVVLIGGTLTAGPEGGAFVTRARFPRRPRGAPAPSTPPARPTDRSQP